MSATSSSVLGAACACPSEMTIRNCCRTTQQYVSVMEQLLAASYHAVSADDLIEALGDDGEAALEAMVKENLLGYRPESSWARDVPVGAFDALSSNLVTAPSAAHLHCMRLLEQQGKLKQSQSSP